MINKNRLVNRFLSYVKIDSESGSEKAISKQLENDLKQIGLRVYVDDSGKNIGSTGNNIYAFLEGKLGKDPILLSAHMDTVSPGNNVNPIVQGDIIKTDGKTVLGGDNKSGLAIIVESIETIMENNLDSRPIEVVFTTYEEKGLYGARNVEFDKLKSKEGIAIDTGGPIGTICNQTPAQNSMKIEVKGKAAHAGIEPEKGISAIEIAAEAISKMPLGRIDEITTANIGTIRGGIATNIITPIVSVTAEARSKSNEKLKDQSNKMKEVFEKTAEKLGGKAIVEIKKEYEALYVDEEDILIKSLKKAFIKNNNEPRCVYAGGGSDANIYFSKGIKMVNISAGMTNVHTVDEYIKISDMVNCGKSLINFLIDSAL